MNPDVQDAILGALIHGEIKCGTFASDILHIVSRAISSAGFVVVPTEPTARMMKAMQDQDASLAANNYWSMYMAAISQHIE